MWKFDPGVYRDNSSLVHNSLTDRWQYQTCALPIPPVKHLEWNYKDLDDISMTESDELLENLWVKACQIINRDGEVYLKLDDKKVVQVKPYGL